MAEKYKLQTQLVDDLLSVWVILPVTEQIIQVSRNRYDGKDFEDCIQAACAESGDYDEIITIDKHFQLYSHTELSVTVLEQSA
jgi:predicted nucleic acid-binding protein